MTIIHHEPPKEGWQGLVQNWKNDLVAATSVALVALPLALGIAIACGVDPIAGLISSIIGGLAATFFKGGHVSINGPAAGLIAVIITSIELLGGDYNAMLAVFIVSGVIQVALGAFRMGKIGNMVPSYVIHGILAAIGVIILSKQIRVMLGSTNVSTASNSFQTLLEVPQNILTANPYVTFIGLLSLAILVIYPKIENKLIHFIPAAVWVLVFGVPLVFLLGFSTESSYSFLGFSHEINPQKLLINIPDNLLDGLMYPDFSRIGTLPFWIAVISLTLIASIEILAIGKAVDKMDPYKRNTNLDKDLIGNGIGTILAACIGGLPMITVIARSSVNINNGAKTKWSNFYHGLILLVIVILFVPIIQKVPLAALAAILVYTGYKLVQPEIWREAFGSGWEQLLFFIATLFGTLFTDLLTGIFIGIGVTFITHWLAMGVPFSMYWKYIRHPDIKISEEESGHFKIKMTGVANFTTILSLKNKIESLENPQSVALDFSHARLVDFTVLEYLSELTAIYRKKEHKFEVNGLVNHRTTSDHPFALHVIPSSKHLRLTQRQRNLKTFAASVNATFRVNRDWYAEYLNDFHYFEKRPVEYKSNVMRGEFIEKDVTWEICDITFEEGAWQYSEKHKTTAQLVKFPFEIPVFALEKEQFFDKVMNLVGFQDIDFEEFKVFSDKFLLIGHDEAKVRAFFTTKLVEFLSHEDIYHVESNGEALLIFKEIRIGHSEDVDKMYHFCEELTHIICENDD
ncbi:MAG: SulP family inorganic anion transporter [Saprospiraceae bacterium]